ncbi:MAG: ATP-binding cassette domain-containing protein [Bacteroidia bacterium]|jgi:phospholipid/cholesterol/gamma-HCH transport system ATP-binding protein|nr:ATP-binding cassette domain-containing protein [Bacteroidia bacterium]
MDESTSSSNNTVIDVKHLCKSFGDKQILQDISFQITKGENLVILGKSGSGKSVLIKCIIGLLPIDSGKILINNTVMNEANLSQLNEVRKAVGFLFQSGALYDSLSVMENLVFPLRRKAILKRDQLLAAEEVLKSVGLIDIADKMPSELSGGMRKRLGLARTLITKPQFIFYDEPTTGLDPITSNEISELMNSIQQQFKTTSIIITHDMACAHTTANRMLVLDEGKVLVEGSFDELSQLDNETVKAFFKI